MWGAFRDFRFLKRHDHEESGSASMDGYYVEILLNHFLIFQHFIDGQKVLHSHYAENIDPNRYCITTFLAYFSQDFIFSRKRIF